MNSIKNSQVCNLPIGFKLVGKWHRTPYKIIKKLGYGATGSVYLAEAPVGQVALKIGLDNMAITSEVNVLKHFSKVRGQVLGPSLIDVDDWKTAEGNFPFYAMEYLKGDDVFHFLSNKGSEWVGILIVQLLSDLDRLHQAGWVFGDLKPDNLIVVGSPTRIRWIDVGGTTLIGRSIKEYTEFFDRGYWGLGSRKAEPTYDLFAVAMIMINVYYPNRFDKNDDGLKQLKQKIEKVPLLKNYQYVLMQALQGKYSNAQMMRKDMIELISTVTHQPRGRKEKVRLKNKKKLGVKKKSKGIIETVLFASFLLLAYILYLFGQMM